MNDLQRIIAIAAADMARIIERQLATMPLWPMGRIVHGASPRMARPLVVVALAQW